MQKKSTIDHLWKVYVALSENTHLLVTIDTVTMETRHVTLQIVQYIRNAATRAEMS